MTKDRWQRIEAVLDEVLDLPPGERAGRLDALCPDADLRADVEAFLAAEAEAPAFLSTTAIAFAAPLFESDPAEDAVPPPDDGERIGPYRLVRELGRGGMGRVYLAERADGTFEQRVALKVLRNDVASDALRFRLRAERQILAALNHPGIARVFDGGVTADGRPYLVLEYVDGVPIDAYCEQRALPLRARLALFEQVCAAVHHAHRNLVVHRDLKPSNILVTDGPDGDPAVKLLDFGIAKLLEDADAGAGRTAPLTQTGDRWMTPHYAAPEQVTCGAITTSTDVYALGVLLYKLLTGRRPFEELPAHEVARAVVETDPPAPSAQAPDAALGTDLDTIALKALRKEPAGRYASAEALGDDVRRFLEGRPVSARRPTWAYRARKFARRNRWPVAAGVVVFLLAVGAGLWHNARVTTERDLAREAALHATSEAQKAARVAGFLTSLFEAGSPVNTAGDTLTAFDLLDRGAARLDSLRAQPAVEAQMAALIGQAYADLGAFERARPLLERAVRLRRGEADPDALADALEALAAAHDDIRDFRASVALYDEALALRRAATGPGAPLRTAQTLQRLAGALGQTQPDTGIVLAREALALMEAHGASDGDLREAQTQLAVVLTGEGRPDEAAALYRRALPGYRAAAERDSTQLMLLARVLHNFANARIEQRRFEEAVELAREAVAIKRRLDKQAHQSTTLSLRTLAVALSEAGRYDEARRVWQERLALLQQHLTPDHWRIGNAHTALGSFELWRGNVDDAERHLRAAHGVFTRRWPEGHAWIEQSLFRLGIARALQGRYAEAEELLARGAPGFDTAWYYSWNHYEDALLQLLLDHYDAAGRSERVAPYRALLSSREEDAGVSDA